MSKDKRIEAVTLLIEWRRLVPEGGITCSHYIHEKIDALIALLTDDRE